MTVAQARSQWPVFVHDGAGLQRCCELVACQGSYREALLAEELRQLCNGVDLVLLQEVCGRCVRV